MKELLEFLARSLVDHPEQVRVEESVTSDGVVLRLSVAKEDMGRVIGKQGRIAKAIRTVMRSAATRKNEKVSVEID